MKYLHLLVKVKYVQLVSYGMKNCGRNDEDMQRYFKSQHSGTLNILFFGLINAVAKINVGHFLQCLPIL